MGTIHLTTLYADWTLIVFTVFAQLSAGAALFAYAAQRQEQALLAQKLCKVAFGSICIAGIVSILHLQNPFNALYTLTQAGHSWLSREIFAVGIFSGLVFLQLLKPHKCLGALSALMGLTLVFVISRVYTSVAAMPFWSNVGTVLAFYGTCFMLGGALCIWGQGEAQGGTEKQAEHTCLKNLAIGALVLGIVLALSAKLSWIAVFMQGHMLEIPPAFTASLWHLALQILCIVLGLLFILPKKMRSSCALLSVGVLCFVVAELAGRTVFFLAQLKLGV